MGKEPNTYPVESVYKGELYYNRLLASYAMSRYIWEGLPETIPQQVLEAMLLTSEYNRVVLIEKNGKWYIQPYSGKGVGVYDGYEPSTIYANPVIGSGSISTEFYTDETSPVLFENYVNFDMNETIKRTAKKLAQYDSSLDITTVNTRNTAVPTASDNAAAEGLRTLFRKIRAGEYYVLTRKREDSLINVDNFKYLPTVPNQYFKTMTELGQLRNNELRLFMNEIGMVMSKDKSEAVLSNETAHDLVLPITRVLSGLQARKDAATTITELTGYNVTVRLSEAIESMIKSYRNEADQNEPEPDQNEPEPEDEKEEGAEDETSI